MLSTRDNFIETITGGSPDRYVNQYEPFKMVIANPFFNPVLDENGCMVDEWGVTMQVAGQPGAFPLHDAEHRVVNDITKWRETVKPPTGFDDKEIWRGIIDQADAIDTKKYFRNIFVMPGIFERLHHLCEVSEACLNLYMYPEESTELLDVITEVELEAAKAICKYVAPETMVHHDDWGTQTSTFMSMDMFEEFIVPRYKEVYGYYHDHGVDIIVHHSDSFGETLVPSMIDVGINVWQGVLKNTNDIPKLIKEYGGKISFMGAIEDQEVGVSDWTPEGVDKIVNDSIDSVVETLDVHNHYFIPCITQGGPLSLADGVYDEVSKAIIRRNEREFGIKEEFVSSGGEIF